MIKYNNMKLQKRIHYICLNKPYTAHASVKLLICLKDYIFFIYLVKIIDENKIKLN